MNKKKKSKKDKDLLKFLAGVRGEERPTMPRPVVFKNKKKYSRQRDKRVDFDYPPSLSPIKRRHHTALFRV